MAYQYGDADSQVNNSGGQYYIIGRVTDIVLGPYLNDALVPNPNFNTYADLGKIQYELLYSSLNISKTEVMKPAYPFFSFMRQYPLVGEIVLIFTGPSPDLNDDFNNQRLYYYPPYALWNAVNHNVFPNLYDYYNYLSTSEQKPKYEGKGTSPELPKGYTFSESTSPVRTLTPFEGDLLLEGRFGQSIRFGSTVSNYKNGNYWSNSGKNGDPITIIRNGQGKVTNPLNPFATTVEDINSDDCSIYMLSNQEVILEDIGKFPLDSYGISANNLEQTIVSVYNKPASNDSIDPSTQDKNALA